LRTDHLLHLPGYASNTAAAALQTQSADGAGRPVLHLADGMRLDIARVDHLTQFAFS